MAGFELEQIYDKHIPCEVAEILWSPKMDLLAAALVNGGVSLYRMTLQRVWSVTYASISKSAVSSEGESQCTSVGSLCWRPDGRVLVVAYRTGVLCHLELERGEVVHREHLSAPITAVVWSQISPSSALTTSTTSKTADTFDSEEIESGDSDGEVSEDDQVLPSLAPLLIDGTTGGRDSAALTAFSADADSQNYNQMTSLRRLTILAVGCSDGTVTLFLHGVLPLAVLHCCSDSETIADTFSVPADHCSDTVPVQLSLSPDFNQLVVICSRRAADEDSTVISQFAFDTTAVSRSSRRLSRIACRYSRLSSLLTYAHRTVDAACEGWEMVLLEINAQLGKLPSLLSDDTSLTGELLELLLLGTTSPAMDHFLLSDLAEKGVNKLRHCVAVHSASITQLLQRHLWPASLHISEQLSLLLGEARCDHARYPGAASSSASLHVAPVETALQRAGQLMACVDRLQRAVHRTACDFEAFCRWLSTTVRRLSEETPLSDCAAMSPRQMQDIVRFVCTQLRALCAPRSSASNESGQDVDLSSDVTAGECVSAYLQPAAGHTRHSPLHQQHPEIQATDTSWLQHVSTMTNKSNIWPQTIRPVAPGNSRGSLSQCVAALQTTIDAVFADLRAGGDRCIKHVQPRRLLQISQSCSSPHVVVMWTAEHQLSCTLLTAEDESQRQHLLVAMATADKQLATRSVQLPAHLPVSSAVHQLMACDCGARVCAVVSAAEGAAVTLLWLDVDAVTRGDGAGDCWSESELAGVSAPLCVAVSAARKLLGVVQQNMRRARVYDLLTANGD